MTKARGPASPQLDPTAVGLLGVGPPVRRFIRVAGLLGLAGWALRTIVLHPDDHPAILLAALCVAIVGMVAWSFAPITLIPSRAVPWAAIALALGGGVLSLGTLAGLPAVAAAGVVGAMALALPLAAAISALAPAAALATALVLGQPLGLAVNVGALAAVGLLVGVGRRDYQLRLEQETALRLERERMVVERARADVLAERNRLAREMHDVLAHSLGALSVELEALGTVVDAGDGRAAIRERVERARRMVGEGLAEARRAVRALREDPMPVADQIARLARDSGATLRVDGEARPLPPDASLALYRAAQEALTNVQRHAAGAPASVALEFRPKEALLTVTNPLPQAAAAPEDPGTGFGLQGMRERALLLHGSVEAGPSGGGWRVRVRLPV